MDRNLNTEDGQRAAAALRARFAAQLEAERAADPTCGGCGNDRIVEDGTVICPSCAAEAWANTALRLTDGRV